MSYYKDDGWRTRSLPAVVGIVSLGLIFVGSIVFGAYWIVFRLFSLICHFLGL